MWTREPSDITAVTDDQFFEGNGALVIRGRKMVVEAALQGVKAVPKRDAFDKAREYIAEEGRLFLTVAQLRAIYALYPFERARLAEAGWGDSDIREDALHVVANFFLGTHWPLIKDDVDMDVFIDRLQRVAQMFGY